VQCLKKILFLRSNSPFVLKMTPSLTLFDEILDFEICRTPPVLAIKVSTVLS